MSAYSWPCQVALKRALQSITLVAGRIYDVPPQSADPTFEPMIQIGDSEAEADDTNSDIAGFGDDGMVEDIDLHVWARTHAGKMEVKQIADEVHTRLHGTDLAIVGRKSSLCWVRRMRVAIESDGVTAHAILGIQVIHRS